MNTSDQYADRFPVVTICGSMRFYPQMLRAAEQLTQLGVIVLMPHDATLTAGADKTATAVGRMLDEMHRAKIRMSGSVYVVNPGGYIGESTRAEIEYATDLGIPVSYSAPTRPVHYTADSNGQALCGSLDLLSGVTPWAAFTTCLACVTRLAAQATAVTAR